jgi:hypothetical protein
MRNSEISDALRHYFLTGDRDDGDEGGWWEVFSLQVSDEKMRVAWEANRDTLLPDFIEQNPGRRPFIWWKFDAPRQPDQGSGGYWEGKLPEPRQRLGGTGTPDFEVLNHIPAFSFGIPTGWVSKFDEEYYNGRRKDIHGNPIGTEYREGNFKGVAIDPSNPPRFESQGAYLQRHGLLMDAEKKYLSRHRALLEPEVVTIEVDK